MILWNKAINAEIKKFKVIPCAWSHALTAFVGLSLIERKKNDLETNNSFLVHVLYYCKCVITISV